MDRATPEKHSLLVSYLLMGALLVALTASFFYEWAWSAESWFRIGFSGGTNPGYSPGPLIPAMVLLMLSTRLRRLPPTPGIAQRDWFNAAFERVLWPVMTAAVNLWHRFMGPSTSHEAEKAQAYKYRALGVWTIWVVLAVGLALSMHYGKSGSAATVGLGYFLLEQFGLVLLFLHIVIFSAAVFYVAWRIFCAGQQSGAIAAPRANQVVGMVLVLFFLIFHFAAVRGQQERISIVSFLGCLMGLLWFFYGWRVARLFIFPLVFMIFTLPMEWVEDKFGLPAQIFATKHSVNIMRFLGVKVEMIGSTAFNVLKGETSIDFNVAAPCSGLKSLVALLAISATYGYMTQKTVPKIVIIMLCAPLIAIVANIVRLVTVGVVAQFSGRGNAMWVHDHAFPIYILAILLLMLADKAINSKWLRIEDF